jgi:hypothetical protein
MSQNFKILIPQQQKKYSGRNLNSCEKDSSRLDIVILYARLRNFVTTERMELKKGDSIPNFKGKDTNGK